jgi:L-ascorbate metabolism protein UlaG (beta-lactamase superfamily)
VRLRPDIEVTVRVEDRTAYGSPIGSRPEQTAQTAFGPVAEYLQAHDPVDFRGALDLLEDARSRPAFHEVTRPTAAGWSVREEVRYPDAAAARHCGLILRDGDQRHELTVPPGGWAEVHEALSCPTDTGPLGRFLAERGLLTDDGPGAAPDCDLTFLGHNTVLARAEGSSVLIDPFLRPASSAWPENYQPMGVADLGPVDAVCITHSHPDHFDPATLLQLPRSTPIIVPELERETLLAVAMEHRLKELGFEDVRSLRWWSSAKFGCLEVTAIPFHGEQPTDGEVLHPEIRNMGNTYVVRAPGWSAAFLADSGRDHLGDVRQVAEKWRHEREPVDVVFGGYRGWTTYPPLLLRSSVARYVLFVPPDQWSIRQRLMNDAEGLIDSAERFGARWVVPYADGGAPWFWSIGLGPRLDGTGVENPAFDPFPERVIEEARCRMVTATGASVSSSVEVLLLRPGDSVRGLPEAADIVQTQGHLWPW